MPFFEVNRTGLERLRAAGLGGSDRALAQLVGVSPATMCRVLSGQLLPSASFIAGVVHGLGKPWFDILFTVVDEREAS